jgi:hypothetical protein
MRNHWSSNSHKMLRASVLLVLLAVTCDARRWRHIHFARPIPKSVEDAAALHAEAKAHVHKEMLRHGHIPPAIPQSCEKTPDSTASTASPLITPTAFGADPSGNTDSTHALTLAMASLTNVSAHASHPMADSIVDLGGATLDLLGGEYLISAPLIVPPHVGNLRIRGGTLRASPSFPATRFLIEVGQVGCNQKVSQGVCNEFIGMDNLFFDAAHVAAGGLMVANTMGTTVGPSAFFTGFVEAGLRITGGHETILTGIE